MVDGLTPDNVLEDTRGTDIEPGKIPLKEDNDPPAAPASDPAGRTIPKDHQLLDSNIDDDEAYSEGIPEAAEE